MNCQSLWLMGGYDPSGHAGITVDHRTVDALGVSYASLITALTVQNATTCHSIKAVDPSILMQQAETLLEEEKPSLMKIGMIPDVQTLMTITGLLNKLNIPCIVDPVISTSSGDQIVNTKLMNAIRKKLFPKTTLLTPNRQEAETLSGVHIHSPADYPLAAKKMLEMGTKAVLIKDGHGFGEWCVDYFEDQSHSFWIWTPRQKHKSVRGTGCCLSSAISAAYLQLGELAEAVIVGIAYVKRAIRLASPMLYHAPWPVESTDMPCVTDSIDQKPRREPFPLCGFQFFGFYPIVPSADWIDKLVEWRSPTAQLRVKESCPDLNSEIQQAVKYVKGGDCSLFINDHWELAVKHHAYGVHLGQTDILKADIASLVSSGVRLGISTHSYEELARALAYNPSYVALGPIFPTTTKKIPWKPQGIDRINNWKELAGRPLVAIGGMSLENARDAWLSGADAIAFVRELTESKNPEKVVKQWNEEVHACFSQMKKFNDIPVRSDCKVLV
jgi:hydroxymethylpyrimidine kinase / phosphomethylpyrimidine kinase / thiamine-phosphate diphosphorylase